MIANLFGVFVIAIAAIATVIYLRDQWKERQRDLKWRKFRKYLHDGDIRFPDQQELLGEFLRVARVSEQYFEPTESASATAAKLARRHYYR